MPARVSSIQSEPNIVPMIDVLLVLLIIFMLFAVIGLPHHPIQLPVPSDGGAGGPTLVLSVDPGPTYSINGQGLRADNLQQELTALYAGRPDKILFVRGAREVRYQDVVHAFGAARGAGVHATAVVIPPR